MTKTNSLGRRAARGAAVLLAALTAACAAPATGPSMTAAPAADRAATAQSLAPSVQRLAGRSGYMLSSGFVGASGDGASSQSHTEGTAAFLDR